MSRATGDNTTFWRDPALPQLELRLSADGAQLCYAPHSHTRWSIGAITRGQSSYVNGDNRYEVEEGTLVLMNPHQMHACNPVPGSPWAYTMLYVDADWLAALAHELGLLPTPQWRDFGVDVLSEPDLYRGLVALGEALLDPALAPLGKQEQLLAFLEALLPRIAENEGAQRPPAVPAPANIQRAVALIERDCTRQLSLEELSAAARCSQSHLIRAFKRHTGFSPHAYLLNRRVQFAQERIKDGESLAEAALQAGFADQAHFQRVFKKHLATTPHQYR